MGFAPGQVLGRYRLLEPIGSGGMGAVYRAHDTHVGRDVAIKSLAGGAASNPDLIRRFVQETADAPRVVHPYVATVFDVIEHGGAPLIVMEYVKGRPLDAVVRDDHPPPATIARYGQEIAEALTAIHAAGLVHRDLKPANVMVTDAGHVKVLDFGVARRLPPEDLGNATTQGLDELRTRPDVMVGTPAYMSPEQVACRPVDIRSDLFSLGIILFEAVTGNHPFRRASAHDTVEAIVSMPPGTRADRQRLKKHGRLGDTIAALLEKQPSARPADAAEVARRLQEASLRDDSGARRALLAVAGLMALTVTGYAVFRVLRPPTPPGPDPGATRPALAVLPFEFQPGGGDGSGRGTMVADLISSAIGESGRLRAVSPDRIIEVLGTATAATGRAQLIDRVQKALSPDWLVTGTLYTEDADLLATVWVYGGPGRKEPGSFQVRARRLTELAKMAAARMLETTGAPVIAGFTPSRPPPRFAAVDEAQLLAHDARQLAAQSRYDRAIAQLEKAVGLDPGFIDAHVLLAEILDRVGYEGRSRATIQKAARLVSEQGLSPDSRQALQAAAVQGHLMGLPGGLESLRRLATIYPDEPDTLLALANALHLAGKEDESATFVDRAAAIDPNDVRPLLARARLLTSLNRTAEAKAALDEAEKRYTLLESGVGLAEVFEARGRLHYQDREYAEAEKDYRRSSLQFRKMGLPIRGLAADQSIADMDLMLWRLDEAEAGYRATLAELKAAGWYSQVVDTLAGLGGLLLRAGRLEEAEATLKEAVNEALKLGNEQMRLVPLMNLANVYCYSGRPSETARTATEVMELARAANDAEAASSAQGLIALAAQLEGRFEEATTAFRALAEEADARGSTSRRGYLLGQLAEAQEWAEQPAAALDSVNRAIQVLEPLGPGVRLAYRLACRARLLALFGKHDEAGSDLTRLDTMTGPGRDLPQVRDMLQVTRATLDLAAHRLDAVLSGVSIGPGAGPRASLYRGAAELLRAEAQMLAGDAKGAAEAAGRIQDHPFASAVEKAAASLLKARALLRLGRIEPALRAARFALEQSETMALPLTTARAAALIMRLDARSGDAATVARTGRAALQRYLDSLPPEARADVSARDDVSEAISALGE